MPVVETYPIRWLGKALGQNRGLFSCLLAHVMIAFIKFSTSLDVDDKPPINEKHLLLRHPLLLITAVAFVGSSAGLIVAAFQPANASIALFSNLATFVGSSLLSYFITHSNERAQFAEEIKKFADFSRRRVELLSANLRSLTTEIANVDEASEIKRIVTYTLRNLEQDARASVRDIEDMGGIEITPREITKPVDPEPKQSIPVSDRVVFECVACGKSSKATLGTMPGYTKHVSCEHCSAQLMIHRQYGGAHKVVAVPPRKQHQLIVPSLERLSDYAAPKAATSVHGGTGTVFQCGRCGNNIQYTATTEETLVQRPCFNCLSVCTLDRVSKKVTTDRSRLPIFLESIPDEFDCQNCGNHFRPIERSNKDGDRFFFCVKCSTIYRPDGEKKFLVEKSCASPGCDGQVKFKVSHKSPTARQFCLECASRLHFDSATDTVSVSEKLIVPIVQPLAFEQGGRLCPHCGNPSLGHWKKNAAGRRLSVCWSCKELFEIAAPIIAAPPASAAEEATD